MSKTFQLYVKLQDFLRTLDEFQNWQGITSMFLKIFWPKLLLQFSLRLLNHKTSWRNFLKMYINLFDLLFFLRDCLWGIVYSLLLEDEQDPSTFSSSKSSLFLDILTFFKEFLRTEYDFQQNSSWVTSLDGWHWFRAVQFRLNFEKC